MGGGRAGRSRLKGVDQMGHRSCLLGAGMGALALSLAVSSTSRADTLPDALTLAYQTNPSLLAQRAQLRSTDETYVQALAGYRPTANLQGTGYWEWQRFNSCSVLFGCYSVQGQPFSQSYNYVNGQVQVNQPIFTGGRVTARVKGAEATVLAGREQLRQVENQLMLTVIGAYEDVRRDEQALDIRRDNVGVLQRQVEESRARFEAGEVTRTDVAQSQAQLAAAQALLSSAQANLASDRAAYATVVGQSPTKLANPPPFKVFPKTIDEAFDTVEQNNPSIRIADYNEQATAAQVAEAKAQRLPSIGFQGSYGYEQPISPWSPSQNVRTGTVSVTLQQSLFTGGQIQSQIRQYIEQDNAARVGLEQARRVAVQNVSQAWNVLLAARANIVADEEQVRSAQVAFEGTQAEQQVGLRTTLEVLNAQQVLENAQLSLLGARHDEYVASAQVLNIMGLLEARLLLPGIALDPGGHSFSQLRRTTGYVPGLQEVVSAIDSAGAKSVVKAPPPADAPITTGAPDARPPNAVRPNP
jgi:outer membrane protein